MSFKAVFQFFLQVHDFANVDLPSQGIFRLGVSLYQQQPKQKIYATPFEFMEESTKPTANPKKIYTPQSVQPPYFYTKSGIIKYSDEIVVFNDRIRFKLQIQSFPRLHSEQVYLEFQLLYADYCYSSQLDFNVVGTKKFRLENIEHGIMNYCEGEFLGNYPSKFGFTLFACLTNFKFGKYKLPHEMQVVGKEDEDGRIKVQNNKASENVRVKQQQRSNIQSFEGFLQWVGKYYKDKVTNALSYFYNTYTKNLRYYFYLAQDKLNQNSMIKHLKVLKVPKQFLQFSSSANKNDQNETEVQQSQFRKYMTNYEPQKLSAQNILLEINTVYTDIYMFLMTVEKEFTLDQLMKIKMKNQYDTYVKERYGERVFRSVVKKLDITESSSNRENKRIAKKMREKQGDIATVSYPIEDTSFIQGRNMMQFLFYEITNPKTINSPIKTQKQTQTKSQIFEPPIQSQVTHLNNNHSKIEADNIVENILQPKQEKEQTKIKNEDQDVYTNVNHEKGSVDSQRTQKSLQKEEQFLEESMDNQGTQKFQGISQIECKFRTISKKTTVHKQQSQSLPELKYNEKDMLIIMCHGFQGSSYDMTILLRTLKQLLPGASYLVARCNEGGTEGDIDEMGKKLHDEVENFIKNYMERQTVILNFIGHSMGGIIARAGVKYLKKKYNNQFGFFCSLSSPHLGYLNGVDGMIKAGLWAILKFKPIKSLQQLKMEDEKDLKQTFLFKLASEGSLKRFRKIILFSSFEDSYVSWHSARISVHNGKNSKLTRLEQQMVCNILGSEPIHRIDVNFNVQTKNLDSFIGRTAHINLIIQQSLFKITNATIPDLFDIRKG